MSRNCTVATAPLNTHTQKSRYSAAMKMNSGYSMGVAEAMACHGPIISVSMIMMTPGTLVSMNTLV